MSYLVSNSNISAGEIIGDAKTVLTRCVPVPTGSKRTEYPIGTPVFLLEGIAYPIQSSTIPFYGVVYSNRNLKSDDDTRLSTGVEDTVEVIVSGTVGIKCANENYLPKIGDPVIYDGTGTAGVAIGVCDGTGHDRAGNACVAVRLTGNSDVTGNTGEIVKEFTVKDGITDLPKYGLVSYSTADPNVIVGYDGSGELVGIALAAGKAGEKVKVLLKGRITVPFVYEGSSAYAKLSSSQINGIKSSKNVIPIGTIISAIGVATGIFMSIFAVHQSMKAEKRQAKLDAYYANRSQNSVGYCQGVYDYSSNQARFLELCEEEGINDDDIDGWLVWDFEPNAYVGTTNWKKYKLADMSEISNDASRLCRLTHGRRLKDGVANEEVKPLVGHIYAVGEDNGETVCFDLDDIDAGDDDDLGDYQIAGICASENVTEENGGKWVDLLTKGKVSIELSWKPEHRGKIFGQDIPIDFKRCPFDDDQEKTAGIPHWRPRVGKLLQEASPEDATNDEYSNKFAVDVDVQNPNTYVEVYPNGSPAGMVPQAVQLGQAVIFETRYKRTTDGLFESLTYIRPLNDPYDMRYSVGDGHYDNYETAAVSSGRFGVVTFISDDREMCVVQTSGYVKHSLSQYETNIQLGDRLCVRRLLMEDDEKTHRPSIIIWDGQAGQNSVITIDNNVIPVAQPPMPTIGVVKSIQNFGTDDAYCIVHLDPRVEANDNICTTLDIPIPAMTVCTLGSTYITAPVTGLDFSAIQKFVHDSKFKFTYDSKNQAMLYAGHVGAITTGLITKDASGIILREPVAWIKLDYDKLEKAETEKRDEVVNKVCHGLAYLIYTGDSKVSNTNESTNVFCSKDFFCVFHDGTRPTDDPEEPEPVVVKTTAKKTAKKSKKTSEE